ncbi:VanZ family protein [uncultured Brachybacterium sp.]|uniref:VanZ family protein n=1 Tax=uncultured Brachybacterium sp. TaxID=189680 RepID=UPI00262B8AAF|nr:VanZ family protein [uncultured Brachybacterium sp.]
MDVVVDLIRRLPSEVRRAGGSLVWRLGLLALALLLNIGFYLPSLPGGIPGAEVPGLDKVVHLLVFALTVFAAGRVLAPRKRFPMGWVVIVALAHAVLIELVQLVAMPARSGDAADVLFDAVGIALGVATWVGERVLRQAAAQRQVSPEGEPVALSTR